jgi:hypothetical protein
LFERSIKLNLTRKGLFMWKMKQEKYKKRDR